MGATTFFLGCPQKTWGVQANDKYDKLFDVAWQVTGFSYWPSQGSKRGDWAIEQPRVSKHCLFVLISNLVTDGSNFIQI